MTSQAYIRDMNERRVLSALRREGNLSRAELARRLGLTRSGVTYIADSLLSAGLVREAMTGPRPVSDREAGRPGVALAINPSGHFFAGVEIGIDLMRFVLLDAALGVASKQHIALDRPPGPGETVTHMRAFLDDCQAEPRFRGKVRALGATVPGLVRRDGFILHLPILGWRDVNLLDEARAQIDLPFSIENNANAAAFGDIYRHPRTSEGLTLFLKLGHGCGGAAIIDGRLLRGAGGVATEFGHMRIADSGPRCHCGQTGCLETYVNLSALGRYLAEEGSTLPADPGFVASALENGDAAASSALLRLEAPLAAGMVSLANIFNPSGIVLGGAMRPLLELGIGRLRDAVAAGVIPGVAAPAITLSRGEVFECAIGAAAIAHHLQFDEAAIALQGPAPISAGA